MIFNSKFLTYVAVLGSISSVVLATPAPAPDAEVDPRQITVDATPLYESVVQRVNNSGISLHLQVFKDGGAATLKQRRSPVPSEADLSLPAQEKRAFCNQFPDPQCLPGTAPPFNLCEYLENQLLISVNNRIPGNGNSVCIAKVTSGAATTYCCAHTNLRVTGLTYGDLLAPTTQMIDQCVAPNSEQGKIRYVTLRGSCVNFCLDTKPTGCT